MADGQIANNNAQNTTGQENQNANPTQSSNATNNVVDYAKIQEMIDGRNAKTEDSILKSYFEKQGLSKEEMESAISAFKTQKSNQEKAQGTELANAQASLKEAQQENQRLKVERKAYDFIDELNVDIKTIPYLLKMANLDGVVDKDGNISDDGLKSALNKVLEDVPGLKKQVQVSGGISIGADTSNSKSGESPVFDFGFSGVRPKKNN